MKSLKDYIYEAEGASDSKSFTFDFGGMENVDETIKSAQEIVNKDGADASIDGNKIIISISAGSISHLAGIQELLNDYLNVLGHSQKRSSDEQYAQKIAKLERTYGEMMDFWDDVQCADDEENKEASEQAPAAEAADNKDEEK